MITYIQGNTPHILELFLEAYKNHVRSNEQGQLYCVYEVYENVQCIKNHVRSNEQGQLYCVNENVQCIKNRLTSGGKRRSKKVNNS